MTESQKSDTPKILWVDDDPLILNSAERLFRRSGLDLVVVDSPQKALKKLADESFAVVISDQKMPKMSGIELMEKAKSVSPLSSRILLTGFLDDQLIEEAVNRGRVFRFATKPWEDQEILNDVYRAVEHHQNARTQSRLIREVKRQNEELERLNSNLERIVTERTEDQEHSKKDIEKKNSEVRNLVRFIKDLSVLAAIEDIYLLLRSEIRSFHRLGEFYLALPQMERASRILFARGKQVISHWPKQDWVAHKGARVNDREDRIYLANEFGKPFGLLITVPIWLPQKDQPAMAFFEHSLAKNEVDTFLDYIQERLKLVGAALDRRLLEVELKEISYQWENTFDGMRDPVAIIDMDYKVLRSNRHFQKREMAKHCYTQFADKAQSCTGCPLPQVIQKPVEASSQVRIHERQYVVNSYPIRWQSDEKATTMINHYVDVTRDRELYSQWVQNEKMVAIGTLAGNIAHELNNPLTGLRSLAQVLIEDLKQHQEGHLVSDLIEVESAARRCQGIIQNLLNFSSNPLAQKKSVESLNEIIRRTVPLLKTALRNYNVGLNLATDEIYVLVEPHLMQQVIFNILHNSCQAMGDKGEIEIRTQCQDGWAEVLISDNGPGIPAAILPQIFEAFFTTKKTGQGTGLGLSMSRSIVENFAGKIEVTSEPNKLTEFRIRLPLARGEKS